MKGVDSRYNGQTKDRELVSVIARVRTALGLKNLLHIQN